MLNMLPKFALVVTNTYLRVLANARRPSSTPSREHLEVLAQQHHVGRAPGDVHGRVHGDPYVGRVERRRVVDAIAEKADGSAAARGRR